MSDPSPAIKPKRRLWLRILLVLLFFVLAVVGYYGYQLVQTMDQVYQPPTREKSAKRENKVDITEDPVSILLLGVDERKQKNDRGRSDTMMVITINPRQQTLKMMNIPRDTYTVIPGRSGYDKINHAYAFGGEELAITSVEEFLDIPIDYYAKVNMEGFTQIIDVLGGVEVQVPFDFEYLEQAFKKGPMHLDGEAAIRYTQMRKEDPQGDLGRNVRQQQVIKAILKKGTSPSSWSKWDDLLDEIGDNLTTDIAPKDIFRLQGIYRDLGNKKMETVAIKGENQRIDGIYYYVVPDEEKARIQQEIREHLEMSTNKAAASTKK
ncbi:LCP family protein [Desmospora activa]|uniref:LytR family transcriptional attenuator n=1 Tax=Desmospora activa DSM 45169 TaxID=1121389 RepID=A0A2T4Z4A7_9BACL|nr:LCP family protein [Desmospora activa]PTM56717.1 LytR family transcriptional attenuator [Desmospora activa DSM 45169]